MKLTRFLTEAERTAMNDDAISRGYYRDDRRIFQPGWGWFAPWYWDPEKAAALGVTKDTPYDQLEAKGWEPYGYGLLSRYYWETWSTIRPPLVVVCPNGEQWEVDRKSSNGEGWVVEGEWPNITCSPSIVVKGYHGFLQGGEFTPDVEGRPPAGILQYDPAEPPRGAV